VCGGEEGGVLVSICIQERERERERGRGGGCVCVYFPIFPWHSITSNLRHPPLEDGPNFWSKYVLKEIINELKIWKSTTFVSKYISLFIQFTTLLASPIVLWEKWYLQDFQAVKNNTSNLRCTQIFSLEKCEKKVYLKFQVTFYHFIFRRKN
jgi:hypothetical protein